MPTNTQPLNPHIGRYRWTCPYCENTHEDEWDETTQTVTCPAEHGGDNTFPPWCLVLEELAEKIDDLEEYDENQLHRPAN